MRGGGSSPVVASDYRTASTPVPVSATIVLPVLQLSNDVSQAREPLLKPGFLLNISVAGGGRREFSEERKRVADDGTIGLPLVGTLRVEGMTLKAVSEQLRTLYAKYLRNPLVEMSFCVDVTPGAVSPWGSVTVLGRVKSPGSINIPPTRDLSVSRAIQCAGGLDSSANDSSIRISRHNSDGTIEKIIVNLPALGTTGNIKNDINLRAGDVVYVPETIF